MNLKLIIPSLLIITSIYAQKNYVKKFDDFGNIKAEGWMDEGIKTDYWIYYFSNGNILKKGDYKNGKMNGYWYFYAKNNDVLKEGFYRNNKPTDWWTFNYENSSKKIQFKKGIKEGFALVYKKRKLYKVEKYMNNLKTGEWTSVSNFKRDNPNVTF